MKPIIVHDNIQIVTKKLCQRIAFASLDINDQKIGDFVEAQKVTTVFSRFAKNSLQEVELEIDGFIFTRVRKNDKYCLKVESYSSDFNVFYLTAFDCDYISSTLNRIFTKLYFEYSYKS